MDIAAIDDFLLSNSHYTPTNYMKILIVLLISSVILIVFVLVMLKRWRKKKPSDSL